MTLTMFMTLVTICSVASGFLTQAVKQWFQNEGKMYSANLLALINAAVVGCGGTIITYMLMNIPFNAPNIACIILMTVATWLGSMIGYDKVLQLITQVTAVKLSRSK